MTMKCPECKSEKFYTRENDPTLMDCEGCHGVCSTGYAKGFWIGYLEATNVKNFQLLANKWKDQADETDDVEEQKWLYACVADLQTLINQEYKKLE